MTRRISLARPSEMLDFDGERVTPWVTTQILSAHLHRYFTALDLARGKRVLDIACGEGYGSALLRDNGAAQVTGVDIDADIVARAGRVYGKAGLEFHAADIRCPLPFPDASFDLIVSFETIEHIAEHNLFLSELKRVLAPAGHLVISTPDADTSDPGIPNPFHEKELSRGQFLDLLGTHFAHVTPYSQGYLLGSIVTGPGEHTAHWKRTGFLDYEDDGGITQKRYVLAVATDGESVTLPTGVLHDGAIVASLNRRINELITRVNELEANAQAKAEEPNL